MKALNRQLGKLAEDLACLELSKKGYEILKRNFQNRFGEIDIIAKHNNVLVFVEVKAKTGTNFGLPEEMVGRGKLAKVRSMATIYNQGKEVNCRIDVVAVVLDDQGNLQRLTHYENVY
jgi:putative endonuclease